MFSFPLSYMVGGIFYEHGHRLIASTVGMLTVVLALWIWRRDPRSWMRRLGFAALGVVVLQGILGGVTVLYFLPDPVSIGHAGLAEVFFCLTVALALFTSDGWLRGYHDPNGRGRPGVDDRVLARLAGATTALVFVQILVGATMRHTGAGLAIPDFPLAFGGLVPRDWTAAIAVHYAHRVGALIVSVAVAAVAGHVLYHHRASAELARPALVLVGLVVMQVTLGAFVIWTGKSPFVNTAHVGTGALVLVTSVVLTLRSHRVRFATLPADAYGRSGAARMVGRRSFEARA
jgi:cytochrome c oxidase assembly protein subunit 15